VNRLDEAPRWLLGIVAAAHGAVLLGLTFPAAQRFAPPRPLQVALVTAPAAAPAAPSPLRPAEARSAPAPRRTAPAPAPAPATEPASAPATDSDIPARETATAPAPALVASAHAAPSAAPAVADVLPPRFDAAYLNNPKPSYPPLARRMGEEGKATLRVHVTPEGLPERIELAESAGSPRLDEAALEAVRHWRFVPARQGDTAVAAWVRVPIVFRLEKNR
jgi:protein TonB